MTDARKRNPAASPDDAAFPIQLVRTKRYPYATEKGLLAKLVSEHVQRLALVAPRIADLGCGTGQTAKLVLARCPGAKCLLVDKLPNMIAQASRFFAAQPDVEVRQFSLLERFPPDLGKFEVVLLCRVLRYISQRGVRTLLSQFAPLLVDTARVFVVDNHPEFGAKTIDYDGEIGPRAIRKSSGTNRAMGAVDVYERGVAVVPELFAEVGLSVVQAWDIAVHHAPWLESWAKRGVEPGIRVTRILEVEKGGSSEPAG